MNAMVSNWIAIGTLDDIPRQGSRCVKNGSMTIAVFRTFDDRLFAMEDRCPHKNGPLSQGIVHDGCVTCPMHNWVINLATGKAEGADEGATRTFAVRLEGDIVYLDSTAAQGGADLIELKAEAACSVKAM